MMHHRGLLAVLGLSLVIITFVTPPALEDAVEIGLTILGNDYLLVGVLGLVALVGASLVFATGRSATLQQTDLPNPEHPVRAPSPGAHIDNLLDCWWIDLPVVGRRTRATVREEIRAAALELIRRHVDADPATARRLVETGEWTDDEQAGAFLQPTGRNPFPLAIGVLFPGTAFGRRANRTIRALETLANARQHEDVTEDEHGGLER